MSEIDLRITRARSQLILSYPFFGALVMRLIAVERNDVTTMATDGRFLFYCRTFLDKISETEILYCVAHEVLHCALSHMTRRGSREWPLWQAATDYVVNLMLRDAGFTVPKWVKYFDEKYRDLNVEQIYQLLAQDQQKQQEEDEDATADRDSDDDAPGSGDQEPNQEPDEDQPVEGSEDDDWWDTNTKSDRRRGHQPNEQGDNECTTNTETQDGGTQPGNSTDESGEVGTPTSVDAQTSATGASSPQPSAGDGLSESLDGPGTPATENYAEAHGDPGGCGEVLDAAPAYDKAALDAVADEWQVYTRQATNIARRQGEGKLPGFIEEIVEVLNDPKTDWREVLRRFVDPSNTKDYSWANPNRRMMALGYYTPGVVSDGVNHIAFVVDTSISIDHEWLRRSGCEIQAALDDGAVDKITLVLIDEQVHRTAEYVKGDIIDFTVQGRGGTRFAPAFAWLNDNSPDVSAAVYLTDLECSDYGPTPSYPVLWAAYGTDPKQLQSYMRSVPFGECLELRQ